MKLRLQLHLRQTKNTIKTHNLKFISACLVKKFQIHDGVRNPNRSKNKFKIYTTIVFFYNLVYSFKFIFKTFSIHSL